MLPRGGGQPPKPCRNWQQFGSCQFGNKCHFSHGSTPHGGSGAGPRGFQPHGGASGFAPTTHMTTASGLTPARSFAPPGFAPPRSAGFAPPAPGFAPARPMGYASSFAPAQPVGFAPSSAATPVRPAGFAPTARPTNYAPMRPAGFVQPAAAGFAPTTQGFVQGFAPAPHARVVGFAPAPHARVGGFAPAPHARVAGFAPAPSRTQRTGFAAQPADADMSLAPPSLPRDEPDSRALAVRLGVCTLPEDQHMPTGEAKAHFAAEAFVLHHIPEDATALLAS